MSTWPTTLPAPVEYSFTPRERRRREASGDDPPAFRRFARDAIVDATIRWRFVPDDLATFSDWYDNTIAIGMRWFAIDLPGRGGLAERWVRFIGQPSIAHVQVGIFDVSATLEVRTAGPSILNYCPYGDAQDGETTVAQLRLGNEFETPLGTIVDSGGWEYVTVTELAVAEDANLVAAPYLPTDSYGLPAYTWLVSPEPDPQDVLPVNNYGYLQNNAVFMITDQRRLPGLVSGTPEQFAGNTFYVRAIAPADQYYRRYYAIDYEATTYYVGLEGQNSTPAGDGVITYFRLDLFESINDGVAEEYPRLTVRIVDSTCTAGYRELRYDIDDIDAELTYGFLDATISLQLFTDGAQYQFIVAADTGDGFVDLLNVTGSIPSIESSAVDNTVNYWDYVGVVPWTLDLG